MRSSYTITIRKKSQSDMLLMVLVFFPFLLGTLNEFLHLPWSIRYLMDFVWIVLLGFIMLRHTKIGKMKTSVLSLWVVLFFCYTLLTYVFHFQSPLYYLWGMRNNFRFYVAFLGFIAFLRTDDIKQYLSMFELFFWINIVVSLFQFIVLGLYGDHLGGIFSTDSGGNAYTNLFMLLITTVSLVFYMEKKESLGKCFVKCGIALFLAALAELKFFFVEFIVLLVLTVLFTRFTWRKFWVIVGGIAGVLIFAALLTQLFPNFAGWFSIQWFLENSLSNKGYTSTGDLNRLNAISKINELWLDDRWSRMIGMGLGNCDTSTYAMLNTPFYESYGDMHYTWLSSAMMYLETGWIGLVFYWGFYVFVYIKAWKLGKYSQGVMRSYCCITRIIAIMCVAISIYNSSLRTEAAYMVYFVMAIPFAYHKETRSTAINVTSGF